MTMPHPARRLSWIVLTMLLMLFSVVRLASAGNVTPASGTALSADTAANGGDGTWATLSGPSYAETVNGDLNIGTVTLLAPNGFEFRTGVSMSVVLVTGASNPAANMNETTVGGNVASTAQGTLSVSAGAITFTVASKSRGNVLNAIRWTGIQVRPLNGYPLASGNIVATGSSGIATAANSNNFGSLTTVPGAVTRLLTILPGQSFSAGTGATGTALAQTAGTAFVLSRLVATDRFFNPITSYNGNRSISYSGPSAGCTVTPSYTTSVNFVNGFSTTTLNTTLRKAENTTITASDGTISGPASSSLAVNAAPASQLVVTLPGQTFVECSGNQGTPDDQTAGVSFVLSAITATDAFFNITTTYSGSKTLSYSGPIGSASYTTSVNFANGQSTTMLVTSIATAQTTTLRASDGSIAGPNSSSFIVRLPPISSFDAFDSTTPAGATSGRIKTKIAGSAFSLDIVALNGLLGTTTIASLFVGTVKVELVDGSGSTSCAARTLIQSLPNQTFTNANLGRRSISGITVPNAWKNVSVRISHPAVAPLVVSCSQDNFAVRPASFSQVLVSDSDAQTTGTARDLNNTAVTGGTVHKAGRPFTIRTTAINSAGATTGNYNGTPVAVLSPCSPVTTACPAAASLGSLTTGSWTNSAGSLSATSASYSEVGAFSLVLQDQHFADVDALDSSTSERYVSSAAVNVGRFVPDHFTVAPGTITPRADLSCPSSSFTYMNEPFRVGFELTARNAAGITTVNYSGPLATLNPGNANHLQFGAIHGGTTPLTTRLTMTAGTGSWMAGRATITSTLTLQRAASPDGPFATTRIGIAPRDPDGVQALGTAFNLDADAVNGNERVLLGTMSLLFGRLWLGNALGSERLNLSMPLQAQYWTGNGFGVNASDNCTAITSASNVLLTNPLGGITAANMNSPGNVQIGGAFNAGIGRLVLTKPLPVPVTKGSIDVAIDLTAEGKTYLQTNGAGGVYNQNPKARATFGVNRGSTSLYMREIY